METIFFRLDARGIDLNLDQAASIQSGTEGLVKHCLPASHPNTIGNTYNLVK